MPIETHLYAAGAWRKAQNIYVKVNGSWVSMREKWVNEQGTWRKVFGLGFEFTDTAVGYNYNLENAARAAGWDGSTPMIANITVIATPQKPGPGSVPGYSGSMTYGANVLGSTSTGVPAFTTGNISPGSTITLTIPAGSYLVGKGGAGGNQINFDDGRGGDFSGERGGTAIWAGYPMTVINYGVVGGGGGGGAMGMRAIFQPSTDAGAGGAGFDPGKGQPVQTGAAAASANGTLTTGGPKPPNNGGYGGNLGQPGGPGADARGPYNPNDPELPHPGAAGYAAQLSGNISWAVYGDVRGPLA